MVEIAQVAPFGCRWTLGVGFGDVREPAALSNGIKQFLGLMLRLAYLGRARRIGGGDNQYFAKADHLFLVHGPRARNRDWSCNRRARAGQELNQ